MPRKTNFTTATGKDYFRVSATIGHKSDGTPIRKQFYGKSKAEATSKKDEFLSNLENGLNLDFDEMPISKLMDIWLFNVVKIEASHNTFDRYESVFRNYVKDTPLAILKVHKIERLYLQTYYNNLSSNGFTSNQIFNLNKLLRKFFNYALDEGYILKNPCTRLVIPKGSNASEIKEVIDPYSHEEIQAILEKSDGTLRVIFQLGLATGLRRGELLGLRVGDVDLDNGTISVNQSIKSVKQFDADGNHQYITVAEAPKTKSSIRTVPIPSYLISDLHSHFANEEKKHSVLGVSFSMDNFFFTSEVCTVFDGRNVLTAWKRLQKRAGVRYRPFHNIRHSYATLLFEARVPLITISRLLGHTNTNITANTYISVMPKEKESAAEELNYLFQVPQPTKLRLIK